MRGGYYELCTDKSSLDIKAVQKKLNRALKTKFEKHAFEYHYAGCEPRILCMEFLEDSPGNRLTDYKVVCVNGEPTRILVCTNRNEGRDYYSPDWEYIEAVAPEYRSSERCPKPEHLEQMLAAAKKLSEPFPLARIDFYEADGKLYFGEVTLTPSAGNHSYLSRSGQEDWGGKSSSRKKRLTDYKIHCSYGEPVCILVCTNRETQLKLDFYSTEWEYLDYAEPNYRSGELCPKPKYLEQMLAAAKKLSEPFPLSRIDFYEVGGKLYFGEVTLTPAAGRLSYLNKKGQLELGEKTRLEK